MKPMRHLVPVLTLVLSGCAGGGGAAGGAPAARQAGIECPPGYTVTCEVKMTGRIHHGTFGKDYDSCSCVSTSQHGETRPVVPRP